MTASIFKESKFNDGQGLDYVDLNNAQRYLRALLTDGVVATRFRDYYQQYGLVDSEGALMAQPGCGYCYYKTGLTVGNGEGLVLHGSGGAPTGNDPVAVPYYLALDELQTTLDAADATHDRWDLIEVQIAPGFDSGVSRDFKDATTGVITTQTMSVIRSPLITKTVKKGIPGASPTKPSVDTGFVPWAYIKVRATQTTLDPRQDIEDWTWPLGWQTVIQPGRDGYTTVPGDWSTTHPLTADNNTSNASDILFMPKTGGFIAAKLVAVRLIGNLAGDTVVQLVRFDQASSTLVVLSDLTSQFAAIVGSLGSVRVNIPNVGLHVWGGGYSIGAGLSEPNGGATLYMPSVGLRVQKAASSTHIHIAAAHFELAGV